MKYRGSRSGLRAALRECKARGYSLTTDAPSIQAVLDRYGKTDDLPGQGQAIERSMVQMHQQTRTSVAPKGDTSNSAHKKYLLVREPDRATVYIQTGSTIRELPHVVYHSPTGFEWGYYGSGPADLARSILTDAVGPEIADRVYQQFKAAVIARMPYEGGTITLDEIDRFLQGGQVA